MTFSPSPTAVRFDDAQMWVELDDGRTLGIPLVWFPRLLHESAEDVATYMDKQNRYTSLHAQALFNQGVRATYWHLLASPVARFVKFYVIRLGFLDGGPGFAHIAIGCNNAFHKYLKLIELQKASE